MANIIQFYLNWLLIIIGTALVLIALWVIFEPWLKSIYWNWELKRSGRA